MKPPKEEGPPTEQWLKRDSKSETEYTETHPSYGCISISQVSGKGVLFGSEVSHQHFLSLTISEARRVVDEPREFVMSNRELVRVSMTQAQFAEMITSPNRGGGTPCTIDRFTGDAGQPWVNPKHGGRPAPPEPEHYTKKFKHIMTDTAEVITQHVKDAKAAIDALADGRVNPTKANLKDLQGKLYSALMNMEKNLPYVMEQMEEGIENRMAAAVSEFESYITFSLKAKGLEYLANQAPRLATPEQKTLTEGETE